MKKNKDQIELKWYQGWRNIASILTFFSLMWPVALVVMWTFALWSRRVKVRMTIIVLLLYTVIYLYTLSVFLGGPLLFTSSRGAAADFSGFFIGLLWLSIVISGIVPISAMGFQEKIGKTLKEIWIPYFVVFGFFLFMLIVFFWILLRAVRAY